MTAYASLEGLSFPGCPEAGCNDQDPAKGEHTPCREAFGQGTAPVIIVVPWPRVPVMTPGGKPSKSKNAGRLIPWLSANVVNNLPKPVYRSHVTTWREAAREARLASVAPHLFVGPVEVAVRLYKATGHEMDPLAVLEGLKPVVDGLEASGLLVNDRLVVGGWAEALKAGSRDECRVEVTLLAVAS